MLTLRKSTERGHAKHGWLESYHSFSFADYYDPQFMGFRSLRVINEDWVAPSLGFDSHPHRDMEILTYIVEGQLKHKDSMGHEAVIQKGEVQKISAGTGIVHSEFNASAKTTVHLLQIWIVPDRKGIKPSYQQMLLTEMKDGLQLFASPQGGEGIIKFEQDAYIYRGYLVADGKASHKLKSGRGAWLQMVKGKASVNKQSLEAGDAVAVEGEPEVSVIAKQETEFLLFDLAE